MPSRREMKLLIIPGAIKFVNSQITKMVRAHIVDLSNKFKQYYNCSIVTTYVSIIIANDQINSRNNDRTLIPSPCEKH